MEGASALSLIRLVAVEEVPFLIPKNTTKVCVDIELAR
jgi:hypothetical protein